VDRAREVAIWRADLAISVKQRGIETRTLQFLSATSGLAGWALAAPWLYMMLRAWLEKHRRLPYPVFLRHQLAEERDNLRLIQERKSQYVMETDVPLQLIKEERQILRRIQEWEQRIGALG
jgi:hypothetical protein